MKSITCRQPWLSRLFLELRCPVNVHDGNKRASIFWRVEFKGEYLPQKKDKKKKREAPLGNGVNTRGGVLIEGNVDPI